jgi:proteasome lid subunit RPN8/RPN11
MLQITYQDYEALRAHGEQTYPHECCGVLLGHAAGDRNEVVQIVPAGNTRTDSAHNRYHIAPQELIRIQRQARTQSLDIVGFYHSHPDHPAQWSQTDFAEAHWLGCSYVITRIAQGKADVTNAFLLRGTGEDDKQFEDEPMEILMQPARSEASQPPEHQVELAASATK